MTDTLDNIEQDVRELKEWATTHDKEHVANTGLLTEALGAIRDHAHNHHSRASTMKQGSLVGAAITLLYVVVELIRQFAL